MVIDIRKNDTKSFMYHALTFIIHFSRAFLLNTVAGFEKVENISKVEHHELAHICPQGYEMSIKTYEDIPIIELANMKDGVQYCCVQFMVYELIAFLYYVNSKTLIVDNKLF